MRRFLKYSAAALLLVLAAGDAVGFTLLGPFAPWQTPRLGYNDIANVPGDPTGGPMNLGEGYRWNVPTIYYSYSPDFLHYFGDRGVQEIEKIIAVLNKLPSMDSVNVDDYPLQSMRINYRASSLGLLDLGSIALSLTVNNLGLTDPTRYVFTLRNRFTPPNSTNYTVVKRNFDPVTFEPTSFINGQLWTYTSIAEVNNGADSIAITEPVDPLALGGLINAPVTYPDANYGSLPLGGFWTGLTRDDVGGLRYLYRSRSLYVENAPSGAFLFVPGTSVVSSDGSSANGSPWNVPVIQVPGATTGGGTTTIANTNIINTAVRPGVGRVNFVRLNYDSQFGFFPSNNVSYTDRVITNGVQISQTVVRPVLAPDILFDAQDLQGGDATGGFLAANNVVDAALFQNNDAVNGLTGGDGPGNYLPTGTVNPAVAITFNKVGPAFLNIPPFFLSEVTATPFFVWGSFDGSTNTPVLYPNGASIQDLEQQALGGGSSGSGGSVSLTQPWTPSALVLLPPGATTTAGGTTGTTP